MYLAVKDSSAQDSKKFVVTFLQDAKLVRQQPDVETAQKFIFYMNNIRVTAINASTKITMDATKINVVLAEAVRILITYLIAQYSELIDFLELLAILD
eukprot:TRINITY_DN3595_c0_g1_i4.p1 TRINITY_DN3595_c0_g1~~TRINITY_DN3595_c0_g1_i4.p1  ORF type:complete len:115 (+),score=4.80 TRINITY_DN3595_c0_g1_i4:52-345(+)